MAKKNQNFAGNVQPMRENAGNAPGISDNRPKNFRSGRLVVQLLSLFAIVLAFVLGVSIFFKVDTITVSGAQRYSIETVAQASGIEQGNNLIFFGRASAAVKIKKELPYVRDVRIGITLPGTVNIEIVEAEVVYSVKGQDGTWWLMTADGILTEQTDGATANETTVITGITLNAPAAGEKAVAYESEEEDEQISATTNADRLNAALEIVQNLEENEILGMVASVDVSNLQDLQFWYGTRYQVLLGDTQRLDYKIAAAKSAIGQLGQFETGVLDATFSALQDQVIYRAFG